MKKLILLATAALLVTGVTFAEGGKKGKKGKKTCCSKSGKTCHKGEKSDKATDEKTVKM